MRKNTLQIGNYALLTRICQQLPYSLPIIWGFFVHPCSLFLEWSIGKVIMLLCHIGKRTGLQLFQIPATVFIVTWMLQIHGLKKKKTTIKSRTANPAAYCFCVSLSATFSTSTLIHWLYDLKIERSIQLTVLCQSLKQTVQASLQAICCAVSGCYLQLFQGIT